MERLDVEGKVWINGERLVTDGTTPVDGCFNFSHHLLHFAFVVNQAAVQKTFLLFYSSAHNFLVLIFLFPSKNISSCQHKWGLIIHPCQAKELEDTKASHSS